MEKATWHVAVRLDEQLILVESKCFLIAQRKQSNIATQARHCSLKKKADSELEPYILDGLVQDPNDFTLLSDSSCRPCNKHRPRNCDVFYLSWAAEQPTPGVQALTYQMHKSCQVEEPFITTSSLLRPSFEFLLS